VPEGSFQGGQSRLTGYGGASGRGGKNALQPTRLRSDMMTFCDVSDARSREERLSKDI